MSLNPHLYPPITPITDSAPRPFWSVIVPAYKPDYLGQALHSVLEQDPGPEQMEILVLDDCSPHALEPLVRSIGGDRVVYFRHPKNLGTYANENAGLSMCRGMWTHILNDDDWVLPGFYSTLKKSLENQPPTVGAASTRHTNNDPAGKEIQPQPIQRDTPGILPDWISKIGVANPVHPVSTVIRRSVYQHLGGYYLKLNYCADWEFYKRCAVNYDWWYEPKILACYRMHPQSVTEEGRKNGEQLRNLAHAIDISEAYLPPDKRQQITTAARDAYAYYAFRLAAVSLQNKDGPGAISRIQAGLEISKSAKALDILAKLMAQPFAGPIRELLPHLFQNIQIVPGPEDQAASSMQSRKS